MQKEHKIILLVVSLVMLVGVVMTFFLFSNDQQNISDDAIATFSNQEGDLPYTDLLGNPVTLDSYLGKFLVVTSWASWSPFSEKDLKNLNELAAEYQGKEIVFLAINRKETKEQAARYMKTLPELSNIVIVLDPRDNFYKTVGGYAMPETITYNKSGEIVNHFRGVVEKSDLSDVINLLTAEQ